MVGFSGFGGIMGKLKGVNINKVFNLGMTLWGIQIGEAAAINAVTSIASRSGGRIGGINAGIVYKLIIMGSTITKAAVLTKFIKQMPFGNYFAPIIAIGTAATVIPQALDAVMELANMGGTGGTISSPTTTTSSLGYTTPFLSLNQ